MSINHNTVYPQRYLVSLGDINQGFTFYGPFVDKTNAWEWTQANLHVGTEFKIIPMFDIRDEHGHHD